MARSLQTSAENIQRTSQRKPVERTQQAFLASSLPGDSQIVHIQFTDPTLSRGSTVRATVRRGVSVASLPVGTPITIVVRHGKAEVVGVPNPSPADATGVEAAIVKRVATQAITNNLGTSVLFDTNDRITEADFHSTTADQEKLYGPWDGWYHIEAYVLFANFGTAGRCIIYIVDSSGGIMVAQRTDPATTSAPYIAVSADVYLVAGDYISIVVFQNSTATVNITQARASIRYLGA